MNTDIRISTSFKGHRKRKKLKLRLGEGYLDYLIDLWISVAQFRPDGILEGWSKEDIAIEAGWEDNPDIFVQALFEVGFLDLYSNDGIFKLHDWDLHNPFAADVQNRSDKARFSRMAKTHPQLYQELRKKGYNAITTNEFKALTNPKRAVNEPLTIAQRNAVAPSPIPSPSPKNSISEKPDTNTPEEEKPKKKKSTAFKPPSLEEVIEYCKERENNVDPEKWYDFYSAKGWMIGKNKMKDWQAAVRTWEKNDDNSSSVISDDDFADIRNKLKQIKRK